MVKINISTFCDKCDKRDNYCENVVIQAVREKNNYLNYFYCVPLLNHMNLVGSIIIKVILNRSVKTKPSRDVTPVNIRQPFVFYLCLKDYARKKCTHKR